MSDTQDPIDSYVTNRQNNVFALRNLPEEVIAVLFAFYSRSSTDLRSTLRKLLTEGDIHAGHVSAAPLEHAQQRAKDFHEKYVFGYGHASVAELATIPMAVENCSILAAKAIEDSRLGSYIEKSTRYVKFDRSSIVLQTGLSEESQQIYQHRAEKLISEYSELCDLTFEKLSQRYQLTAGENPEAHRNRLRAKTFDLLRGLLPAGVRTNVGMRLNARSMARLISKLAISPLLEVREISSQICQEGQKICPTLIKHTEPSKYQSSVAGRVLEQLYDKRIEGRRAWISKRAVELVSCPTRPRQDLARAIIAEHQTGSVPDGSWITPAISERIVHAYLADRGPHDAPGRALESLEWSFNVQCDYGAWRDLQRHRMCSQTTPVLTCDLNYTPPDGLLSLDSTIYDRWRWSLDLAKRDYVEIEGMDNAYLAQYVVPLAYLVEYNVKLNLRELFHLVELRSGRQGHPSYRRIAIEMADAVLDRCEWLRPYLRVDRADYAFAR